MHPRRALLLAAIAPLLAAATCRSPGSAGINYRPATKPTLVNVGGWRWAADTDEIRYTGGLGFQVTVKHTLFNELSVKVVDGGAEVEVPRVDSWPPSGPPRAVFRKLQTLSTDADLMTETVVLHVFPAAAFATPPTPPPDGTRRTYRFYETTADPAITGPARTSEPAEATLVVWRQACVVPLFDVSPTRVAAGTPVTIRWRADECKNVKVMEFVREEPPATGATPHVVEEKTFVDRPSGSLSGTLNLTAGERTAAVGIRASNATGRTWMATVDLKVNPAGPCPENQPYAQKLWFDFCETCLGRPPNQLSVPACTQAKAREWVRQFQLGTNCTVDDGACFADGSGGGSPGGSSSGGGFSPDGCCCRPGSDRKICNPGEAEWACKNSAGATWTEGACK